jgi:phenolic acid decarboxylase
MRLSYDFNLDKNVKFISSFSDFINKYGLIIYTYEGKDYKIYVRNITPNDYDGSYSFISVDDNIINATSIKFVFKIRNINYTYVLK